MDDQFSAVAANDLYICEYSVGGKYFWRFFRPLHKANVVAAQAILNARIDCLFLRSYAVQIHMIDGVSCGSCVFLYNGKSGAADRLQYSQSPAKAGNQRRFTGTKLAAESKNPVILHPGPKTFRHLIDFINLVNDFHCGFLPQN